MDLELKKNIDEEVASILKVGKDSDLIDKVYEMADLRLNDVLLLALKPEERVTLGQLEDAGLEFSEIKKWLSVVVDNFAEIQAALIIGYAKELVAA